MQDGFPRSMVLVLVVFFAVSLLALLGWLVYFVSDAVFFGRPGALGGFWITAVLSGSVALSSGLLALYYQHEDYARGEEVLYRSCLAVSAGILLCSGIWAALISLLG